MVTMEFSFRWEHTFNERRLLAGFEGKSGWIYRQGCERYTGKLFMIIVLQNELCLDSSRRVDAKLDVKGKLLVNLSTTLHWICPRWVARLRWKMQSIATLRLSLDKIKFWLAQGKITLAYTIPKLSAEKNNNPKP